VWLWWCYRDEGVVTGSRLEQRNACGNFRDVRFRCNAVRNRHQQRNDTPIYWNRHPYYSNPNAGAYSCADAGKSADSHDPAYRN
jgi:hypothetical protein